MKIFKNIFGKQHSDDSPVTENTAVNREQTAANTQETENKEAVRQADTLKFDAIRALRINEIDFAINALLKSIELAPRFETHYYLGTAYQQAGEIDSALEQFSKVLEEVPTHSLTLLQRGNILLSRNSANEALQDALSALEHAEESEQKISALKLAAEAKALEEKWEEAIELLKHARKLSDVNLYDIFVLQARYQLRINDFENTEKSLKEIEELNPNEELVPLMRAHIAKSLDNIEEAMQYYQLALDIDPFNVAAFTGITELMTNRTEALEYIQAAYDDQPHNFYLGKLLVQLLEENDKTEEAGKLDKKLAEFNPEEEGSPKDIAQGMYQGGIY